MFLLVCKLKLDFYPDNFFYPQLHAKFEHLKKTQVDEKKKLEEKRRMLVSQRSIILLYAP